MHSHQLQYVSCCSDPDASKLFKKMTFQVFGGKKLVFLGMTIFFYSSFEKEMFTDLLKKINDAALISRWGL